MLSSAAPESVGIPSRAAEKFLTQCLASGMRGLMLWRRGKTVLTASPYPHEAEDKRQVYSVSKSFTGTAVGLAAEEGKVRLDDPAVSYFPQLFPAGAPGRLSRMTIRHLLTMTTGHAEDTLSLLMENRDTPERAFFDAPLPYEPGTHFAYDSGASYMLSAILHAATGEDLLAYLRPRLFAPLGITDVSWMRTPGGLRGGGWGLYVSLADMLKFGILYLQEGVYEGRRILPAAWVHAATARQTDSTLEGSDGADDWVQGYGYQFWRCRCGAYRADGLYRQFITVVPEQETVFAYTGYAPGARILDGLWELCGAMQDGELPGDKEAAERLARLARSAACTTEKNRAPLPAPFQTAGEIPELGGAVTARLTEDGTLCLRLPCGADVRLTPGAPEWTVVRYPRGMDDGYPLLPAKGLSVFVSAPGELTLRILDKNSPHSADVRIAPSGVVQTFSDRFA
ncbi:MAG: serine hydrolase domain-containing protein [Eubacteriales bacterium]